MKLQFRHQPFQADAAKAVCDVFAGQPFRTPTYMGGANSSLSCRASPSVRVYINRSR